MNELLWGVFPYVALTLFFTVPIIRMVFRPYGITTRASSMFNRGYLGVASLLLHWGIFLIFAGHIAGLIGGILGWGGWIAFFFWAGGIGGFMALAGSILALIRRFVVPEVRALSQVDDYIVHFFLITIIGIALYQSVVDQIWGVAFAGAPWFASLFRFQPQPELMASAGLLTQIHVFAGFALAAYFPFTKLVHVWAYPINYAVRPYQSMRTSDNKFQRKWEFGLRSDKSFMTYAVVFFIVAGLAVAFLLNEPERDGFDVALATTPGVAAVQPDDALGGYALYVAQCARCHGIDGDGNGEGKNSPTFGTLPRDLTAGIYRFVSTDNGIASNRDLRHVLVNGLGPAGMPGFENLSEAQILSLVDVLDTFWVNRPQAGAALDPGLRPEVTSTVIALGRQTYADNCSFCHGNTGRGDGEAGIGMEDFPGHELLPANLAAGQVKAGVDPVQLYLRIAAGIPNGDAPLMPSFSYLSP
ncbi:MAG: c-type cytochrome, partial [Alphaproteobacteria bacterium]|nr:c-type cytochrome [Alphaproteobacteria bacterium]